MNTLEVLAALVLESGETWGSVATHVQRDDAEAILDPEGAARFHFLTRSRGYSKTTDLAAVAVAVLLTQAPPGAKCYALAADQAQARLLLDSIEGFARRTPGLAGLLDVGAWKVSTRSGASIEALPADAPSVWGLRPYFAVCDELAEWASTRGPRRIWDAITSAIPKTGGRLVAITTAGSPAHWSRTVRDHAASHPLWRLNEIPGPPPWMPQRFLDEQRERLLPSTFARLFENVWADAEDALVTDEDLRAAVVLAGPLPPEPGRSYLLGLDIGVTRDRTVACVCHSERIERLPEGQVVPTMIGSRVVLDRLEVWAGTRANPVQLADVETWVHEAARAYGARVVADPWQAIGLVQRLRARGLRVDEFTFSQSSVGRLARTLHMLLANRALWLPDDEDLLDELAHVRLTETTPGVVRLAHDSDRHDDRAVALGMAATQLLETRPPTAPGVLASVGWDPGGLRLDETWATDADLGLGPPGYNMEF